MNQRLIDVVKENAPDSWEFVAAPCNSGLNYEIYDVKPTSIEFVHVTHDLNKYKEFFQYGFVRRIQNLCVYGRYILRYQQLMRRSPSTKEEIRYICIPESKVPTLAMYNVDQRHLELQDNGLFKISQMTKNINLALATLSNTTPVLVMARVITERGEIVTDSEVYPEYVVELQDIKYPQLNEFLRNQKN